MKALRSSDSRVSSLNYYGTVIVQQGAATALDRTTTLQAAGAVIGLTGAYAPEAPKGIPSNTPLERRASYQGILKQTSDYLIVGSEQRHLVVRKPFSLAAVSLITVANGTIITVNFFAPAGDEQTYANLARLAENYATQLLGLNP